MPLDVDGAHVARHATLDEHELMHRHDACTARSPGTAPVRKQVVEGESVTRGSRKAADTAGRYRRGNVDRRTAATDEPEFPAGERQASVRTMRAVGRSAEGK